MKNHNLDFGNKKILFIGSGKAIKYPGFLDKDYKESWKNGFQKQLILTGYKQCYIFYEQGEKQEVYKLTDNIVGIVYPVVKPQKYFRKLFSLVNSIKSFIYLFRLIQKINPEIIYTNAPGNSLILSSFLSFFSKKPLVAQVMGSYDLASFSDDEFTLDSIKSFFHRNLNKIIFSIFFRNCSLVLAFNKYCASFAIHNGAHPAKVRNTRIVSHISKDATFNESMNVTKMESAYPIATKKNIIVWSRFSVEKKLKYAILGAIKALKRNNDYGLIVIGYGPMDEEIKNIIFNSDVKERIYLHGFMPINVLISYINLSDIALISVGGYALIEAASMRKPIVCFDLEWHHELLVDGYSAYFADYPSSQQVCEQLVEALDDPEEANRRGQRAYEQYMLLFDSERILKNEEKIIEEFRFKMGLKAVNHK